MSESCDVTYTTEVDCCAPNLAPPIEEPEPPVEPPPPVEDDGCPYYCGFGSPEGVQVSEFEGVAVSGGEYLQMDAATTTHPWWAKRTVGGNTGWRPWAGLGSEGVQSYRIGDGSLASGNGALSFGKNSLASGVSAVALGENTLASGARSEAFGLNSQATADDSKAWGAGAIVNAVRGIGIGEGATVEAAATEGISVGDGAAKSINDIAIGWSHDFGASVAHGSILIGKNATILTGADSSSSTPSLYGGHILIGEDTETPYAATQFQNVIVGFKAKARGRAVIAIGQEAESRAANTPVTGQSEGKFATIVGYRAKASGGCTVAVGDQCDTRGDNTAAVGTNTRANDNSCAAFGASAFAGSATSNGTGVSAVAVGTAAQALFSFGSAFGANTLVNATRGLAIGNEAAVNTSHDYAVAIRGGRTTAPQQVMIGGDLDAGGVVALAIHFNGGTEPAMMITMDGKIQLVNPEPTTTRTFPVAANITLNGNDTNIFVSSTGGARTITLPTSASVPIGKKYVIRRDTASANNVTVQTQGAELFDDATGSKVLNAQWKYIVVQNDGFVGAEWTIIDDNL